MNKPFESVVTITRPANTTAYTAGDAVGVDAGTQQVETATAAGTITAAVAQVETATAAGTIGTSGNATVVVTGAALENSPKTISVAVTSGDTAATWAGKVRTALAADENIADAYTVGGASASITLTAINAVANDATLNISLDNGTCTGITTAATSANTTAGVASGAGNASVTVTSALITGSPITLSVAVAAGDTAATWAGKVRTALGADSRITSFYTVGGSTTSITLTAITAAANDATLNIALANGTCTGITAAPTSANTTSGSATSTTAGSAILAFDTTNEIGRSVLLTDAELRINLSSITSGMTSFRLELYNASPDAVVDNAAWDLSSSGDRSKYLGSIQLGAPVDKGSTLYTRQDNLNMRVGPLVSPYIYGVLVTEGGYTPSSGEVFAVTVGGIPL